MVASARKLRDAYARVPGAPLFKREFGFYCLERWKLHGMPQDVPLAALFDYDPPGQGLMITQNLAGGYMYLRSLIGPSELLYKFYDEPELIHDCMQAWLALADAVIAKHQEYVTLDEIFLAEDICFNSGPLISPDMMGEFLLPYYQQLIANVRRRQIDKSRHLYVQIDTDGNALPVVPAYQQLGMDVMSPFEVASGCDVVEVGRMYPDLAIFGGIDKRILA
jgi:uroporphyrinogen decarboxylase